MTTEVTYKASADFSELNSELDTILKKIQKLKNDEVYSLHADIQRENVRTVEVLGRIYLEMLKDQKLTNAVKEPVADKFKEVLARL